ncbi:MAG: type IV pilus secretin PilQ [Rhodoferax sp.]|uniref:type IV pilus secretin PilQ n=1 Tax=Rhodoferax sp. TaxID=50421 RepID=UPI00260A821F|nr:type IV pilus secretin PilQ [Rhodoferax sp.]MDD5333633.1 type IV pilus secretin PilQ [Rhodoferax sp.]
MVAALVVQAQTAIEAVSGSIQGGVEVVRIDLTQPLGTVPSGFSIQSPARIALDFPGISNAMGRSTVEVNQGNLRSVNVVQAGDRTRVVLNLKQATPYKMQLQGKSLLVVLDAVAVASAPATAAPVFAESRSRDNLPLKDLDFRRGDEGAGRVVVDLPNNQVGVDIRQQGQTLVVEFMKSTLPEGMRRRLDVTDFGTPVQTVTTFQVGDRVRMVIEPKGQWVHSAYQSDEQFVVEVKPLRIDPSKLTQGPGYSGQKLSLNFQNIEVRSLLQVIADFTNFNIITSDSVTGGVTLRLQDVPWDQALDIILQAKGLGMRKTANVIWIAPKDEIIAKEKLELESKAAVLNLEPVRTQSFQMNYAKAEDIAKQLTGAGGGEKSSGRTLSPRGSATADPRTNQLFVTDVASRLEQVQQLLQKLDVAVRQVMIEVRIVEANDTFGKSLGVKFGATDLRANRGGDGGYQLSGDNRIAFGTSYSDVVAASGAGGTVNTSGNFVNMPASGMGMGNVATFGVSIFNAVANRFLNLEISALEADSKGRVVSSPRVVTADGKKASIKQGEQIPYQTCPAGGTTGCTTSFKDANLRLEVTPQITPEGTVIMDLDVSKDVKGAETLTAGPAINVKNIVTQVLVDNGGTVVIGGIFELQEQGDEAKVPWFGDLPGVGNLFKNKSKTQVKKELLVFVTPRIITDKAATR